MFYNKYLPVDMQTIAEVNTISQKYRVNLFVLFFKFIATALSSSLHWQMLLRIIIYVDVLRIVPTKEKKSSTSRIGRIFSYCSLDDTIKSVSV